MNLIKSNKKHKSFFHLNISSLSYHIDDLKILLDSFDFLPDVLGITESNMYKMEASRTNIDIQGYTYVHTPTEAYKGG